MKNRLALPALTVVILLASCKKETVEPDFSDDYQAGGATTVYSAGPDAFTFPLANIAGSDLTRHTEADALFEQQFVTAPAVRFGGLGPLFNQNACQSCHTRNGRSQPPVSPADQASGLLIRLSVPGMSGHGGPAPVPGFGGQFQPKAIFGGTAEGKLAWTEVQKIVQFLDGTTTTLTRAEYRIEEPYQPLPQAVLYSPRNAPPVFGLGLLEAIPEADILALADENDANGDGISGRPNRVWEVAEGRMTLGRFGWKAGSPTLDQQTAEAFSQDMGVSSVFYFPEESCNGQSNCTGGIGDQPDISRETVETTAFYAMSLAPPAPRNLEDPQVQRGKMLFLDAGCKDCHVSKFTTGNHALAALSYQTIHPYTDLLLHDMGDDLADNRPDFEAGGREWRTAPLWGIGLTRVVNPKAGFLHDGRAATLEEAVLWHGGEAEKSREYYRKLSGDERAALLAFLRAL
ncbi:MAG TPA: di-heme oxidoredictase family protein [Flavilitoribacter sp.]|nr:di-heme oxidoredictase family protein [Flavilitoribacter sp.]